MDASAKSRRLRELILAPETLVMPYNLQSLSLAALKAARVARVSLPVVAVFAALRAMTETLRSICDTGDLAEAVAQNRLCGVADVAALFKRAQSSA